MTNLVTRLSALLLLPLIAHAQERNGNLEIEAGIVSTQNMEIRGFSQGNATQDWSASAPTVRVEYWTEKENEWKYGLILQPLSIKYKDVLKNDLNTKGRVYKSGDSATLNYQFPTLRLSANKPVIKAEDGGYIRVGGTALVRYAKVELEGSGQSLIDTNLIVFPTFNIEASKPLGKSYSFFTRSDFLPGIDGNVFLDGLYDVYFGIRKKTADHNDVDVGIRLFFGGYDPKKVDEYANKIFFNSLVVRYSF